MSSFLAFWSPAASFFFPRASRGVVHFFFFPDLPSPYGKPQAVIFSPRFWSSVPLWQAVFFPALRGGYCFLVLSWPSASLWQADFFSLALRAVIICFFSRPSAPLWRAENYIVFSRASRGLWICSPFLAFSTPHKTVQGFARRLQAS